MKVGLAFGATAVLFVASTLQAQLETRRIDEASLSITRNASPSIVQLAFARGTLRKLEHSIEDAGRGAGMEGGSTHDSADVPRLRAELDRELQRYLALPEFPGEVEHAQRIARALGTLDERIDRFTSAPDEPRLGDVRRAADKVDAALELASDFNADHAAELAEVIERTRVHATTVAYVLDAMSVLLGSAAVLLALRGVLQYERLLAEHRAVAEARADELDEFAGRIAHDIRGPLSVVKLALDHAARGRAEVDPRLARGERSLERLLRMLDDLLAFARAGARADPSAHTDVASAFDNLSDEIGPLALEREIELQIAHPPPIEVACSSGVLASIVGNLVRNAMKFIDGRSVRKVAVTVVDRGPRVRIEVADTGPGMSPELVRTCFQPYVRGPRASQPGFGLGLATVKRLVESHAGSVSVESALDQGTTFRVELPKAVVAAR